MEVNKLVLKRDVEKWNKLIASIKKLNIDQNSDEVKAFYQLSNAFKNSFNKSTNERWIGSIKNNLNRYASDRNIQTDLKEFVALCSVWLTKSQEEFDIFRDALNSPQQETVVEEQKRTSKVENSDINQILLNRDVEKFRTLSYAINKVFESMDVDDQSAFEILSKYYQLHFDKTECEELIGCMKSNLNKYSGNRNLQTNLKDFAAICTVWYTKTESEFVEFRKAMGVKERKPIIVEEKEEQKKTRKTSDRIDYFDGSFYIGEILDNMPHGKGKYYWKDGDWHDGDWLKGVQSGKGTFYSASYDRTDVGIYKDGVRYGRGKMVWTDGSWYEGEWNNSGPHGRGTYYNVESKRTDIGDFVDANRDGYGTMEWFGGDRYEGTWKDTDDGIQGKGIYYFSNGYSESGCFVNGKWVKSSDSQSYNRKEEYAPTLSGPLYWIRSHKLVTVIFVVVFLIIAGSVSRLLNREGASPKTEASPLDANYTVVTKVLNIREKPNSRSSKKGQIEYGEKIRVTIYDIEATGFAQIIYQGTTGYVSNKYLRPINSSDGNSIQEHREPERIYSTDETPPATVSKREIALMVAPTISEMEEDIEELKKESTAKQHLSAPDNKTHDRAEQMPVFPGGGDALSLFLQQNLRYPSIATENGIQGRVLLRFVVDKTGSISDIKVLNSLDPSCDHEAIRVVKSMPKWNPGIQDGKPVSVFYMLPITFKLN